MEKVDLRGVPETMLQTLYARAAETQKKDPCIRDPKAVEIAQALDYDFKNARQDRAMSSGVIARTLVLDRITEDFLRSRPGAVVLNLACGLDTRCCRTKGSFARWYNLDLPETMAVREKFLQENGPVYQIAASAMDPGWTQGVEQTDEPVLVIIEGLSMYLTEADVLKIFKIISARFEKVTVLLEVMSPWVVRHVTEKSIEGSHAKFTWGVTDGHRLAEKLPDFYPVADVSLVEGMKVIAPVYKFLGKIRVVRNISNKILVLQKGKF